MFGLQKNIINQQQYSLIVGAVIASAVIPTLVANRFFLPSHLLEIPIPEDISPDERDIRRKI